MYTSFPLSKSGIPTQTLLSGGSHFLSKVVDWGVAGAGGRGCVLAWWKGWAPALSCSGPLPCWEIAPGVLLPRHSLPHVILHVRTVRSSQRWRSQLCPARRPVQVLLLSPARPLGPSPSLWSSCSRGSLSTGSTPAHVVVGGRAWGALSCPWGICMPGWGMGSVVRGQGAQKVEKPPRSTSGPCSSALSKCRGRRAPPHPSTRPLDLGGA